MSIMSAIALFGIIWFLVLFVALPFRVTTQAEAGEIEPGTPASAPDNPQMARKLRLVTIIATALWALTAFIILSGWITMDDIDFFRSWRP